MSESAWKFGAYKRGMVGKEDGTWDERRLFYAIEAIKRELFWIGISGSAGIIFDTGRFGKRLDKVVKTFQQMNQLDADGQIGPKTANALWRKRILREENLDGIKNNWLRAHLHWEAGDDPGAQLINPDGSRDRGLTQSNDQHDDDPLTDDEAFDPATAIETRATDLADWMKRLGPQKVEIIAEDGTVKEYDESAIAVSAMRTPVGALDLAKATEPVTPMRQQDGGSWMQAAAFYILKVDSIGRLGWTL